MKREGLKLSTPRLGTIKAACAIIGGDRPIHPASYYRGVARGIYPPPDHPSPGISRVNLDRLDEMLAMRMAVQACD